MWCTACDSWGGWGEANNVLLHWQKSSCYGQERGVGSGGVGWDNNVIGLAFSCTFTHTSCYYASVRSHALSHIRHATTLLCVLMHFRTYNMLLRFCAFSCTFTHTTCYYASVRSHALSHIRHATTLLCVLMHFHTYVMLLRFYAFSCTFTHTSCYADWICCYASTCSWHSWAYVAGCVLIRSCYASTCLGIYASIWFVLRWRHMLLSFQWRHNAAISSSILEELPTCLWQSWKISCWSAWLLLNIEILTSKVKFQTFFLQREKNDSFASTKTQFLNFELAHAVQNEASKMPSKDENC